MQCDDYRYNDEYTYICQEGYFTNDTVTIKCEANGEWSSTELVYCESGNTVVGAKMTTIMFS